MADILLKNVSKIYAGKERAVSDFSLEIADKDFIVLLGPPGCGKTTVLRMIAGLEEVTEGGLYIGGEPMAGIKPKGRDIAMMFQNYALLPRLTVYDNMAYGLALRKTPAEVIGLRVKEAAGMLGLEPLLQLRPKALTPAQRRRVALARAVVRKPEVLLLDEPLLGLDPVSRLQMRMDIVRLRHKLQTTAVYATQDPVEAATAGAKVAVMDGGRLLHTGTSEEIRETLM